MVDVNSQFFALLTKVGRAKQANADALGLPWKITEMGVGDANDTDPIPSESQTRLINEWRRRPLNQLRVDPVNAAVIIAEQIIPADEGGRWIREIGLYDADGDLVAVANCAPSFKPMLSQGSGRTQVVRMNFIVSSTGSITLKIDPAVVLATREYVDQRITEELYKLDNKQSVRVATTANIALAGLLTIDGIALAAGDRVLVKNQAVAKDNGLYVAAAGVWKRAEDADTNAEVTSALLVSVEQGSALADSRWQLVTDGVIVLGTTALTFQNVTQGFAPINSPALLGLPTAPTAPQFDSSKVLATTEFTQRALGSFSGGRSIGGGAITLVAADVGQFISLSLGGAQAATLPLLADVPAGATIVLHNPSGVDKTIAAAGTDKISPEGAQYGFITLRWGETAYLTKETGVWRLHGSPALRYSKSLSGADWATPPLFDKTQKLATTEFVQRALNGYSSFQTINTSRDLGPTDIGSLLWFSSAGSYTLNLPPPLSLGINNSSAGFTLFATSVGGTVTTPAGTTIQDQSGGISTAYAIKTGQSAKFVGTSSTTWTVVESTAGLGKNADFSGSFGSNGFQKLPSGYIEQWGVAVTDASGKAYVSFTTAFPTALLNITPVHVGSLGLMSCVMSGSQNKAGCTLLLQNQSGAGAINWTLYWRAIGY